MEAFEIPEDEAGVLLTGAGLRQYDEEGNILPFPQPLYDCYCRFKRIRDRIDQSPLSADALVFILMQAGYGVPNEKELEPTNAATLIRDGVLKHGDMVQVKHRNKWCEAKIIGGCGDLEEIIVQLTTDSEERRVPTKTVKVPELVS